LNSLGEVTNRRTNGRFPCVDVSLNLFILARLRNKFLKLILITFESASWNKPELASYEKKHGREPIRAVGHRTLSWRYGFVLFSLIYKTLWATLFHQTRKLYPREYKSVRNEHEYLSIMALYSQTDGLTNSLKPT
jgi:hypothetical protein